MTQPAVHNLRYVAALVTALVGCEQPGVPVAGEGAPFQTVSNEYTPVRTQWGFEVTIPFTYSNTTGDSLYVTNCNAALPITLQKLVAGEWVTPVVSGSAACLSQPLVIAPHSEMVDTVPAVAATPETPDSMIAGTYRLIWHGLVKNYHSYPGRLGDSIALTQRVSNEFAIGPPAARGEARALRTGTPSYSLVESPGGTRWEASIDYTYHNAGAGTVCVVNCNGTVLMRLQGRARGGVWNDVWHPEGDACLSAPIVIAPHAVHRGDVRIWSKDGDSSAATALNLRDADGEYRLVWDQLVLHYAPGYRTFGDALPVAARASNPFSLKRQ